MTAILILAAILALIIAVSTCLHISSKPKAPRTSGTTPTSTNAGTTSSLDALGKIRDKGWPFIVILLALWAWYMTSKNFGEKAGTTFFVVGLIVVVINILILGVPAPFKENKLRKLSYAGFWIVGFLLIAGGIFEIGVKDIQQKIGNLSPASSASASTLVGPKAGDVFAYDVTPDKWTDEKLPQWADIDIARPGRLEYLFPNGKRIIVEDGKPASLGRLPSRNFKIRGTAGKVTFTIQ